VKHEHLPPARISLVYNGVDLRRFEPPEGKPRLERFVVLGVGRLHPQTNFTLFLDVAAELARRGIPVEFRLAGTGPEEQSLRTHASALGISDKVHFLGHVTDTRSLYGGADALLMTSKYEGTPLTVLEAMAMRLPIVAPRLDGIGEILRNEEDALLIEPPDCEHMSAALVRLIEQPEFAARLASKAEEKVRTRFSAQVMAAQVEAVYDICLAATES
jgi:glycosyltransferase involved in cell wall biosynthesis